MDFRIYRDEAGEWRWLLAEDGAPLLASRQSYPSEDKCRNSVAAVRQRVLVAPELRMGAGSPRLFAAT